MAEPVTSPLALTLKLDDDMKKLLPVAEPLMKKFGELLNTLSVISNEAILPPVNKTDEPVICPLSFSFRISPTPICPALTTNPPALPPLSCNAEAVTFPLAFTLNADEEIKN